MSVLMRSVSGIRGVVGPAFHPILIAQYVNAFVQLTKAKHVVVGRDTRVTGPMVELAVTAAVQASGAKVTLLGIASTPTTEMMVTKLNAGAGIIITASHNPIEWNALKFLNADSTFLNEVQVKELFALVDGGSFIWPDYKAVGGVESYAGSDDYHIQQVLALPFIKPDFIRSKKFKIAFDAVNGAGSLIGPKLLQALGCEIHAIHVTPDGLFPHPAEPTPENLKDLAQKVKDSGAHAGFAHDPDADRLALVADGGRAVSEECTLALAVELYLRHHIGPVTVNLSSSLMTDDVAKKYGCQVHRAKVGEINVTTAMKSNGSVIGGEGNGGVILPDLHYGRDGILAIAMILQLMAEEDKTLGQLIDALSPYHMEKQKYPIAGKSLSTISGSLLAKYPDAKIDEQDGLRLSWPDRWAHVRASNTEPIVRVIAEAPTKAAALELCEGIREEL